jgi:hypothetical protein
MEDTMIWFNPARRHAFNLLAPRRARRRGRP